MYGQWDLCTLVLFNFCVLHYPLYLFIYIPPLRERHNPHQYFFTIFGPLWVQIRGGSTPSPQSFSSLFSNWFSPFFFFPFFLSFPGPLFWVSPFPPLSFLFPLLYHSFLSLFFLFFFICPKRGVFCVFDTKVSVLPLQPKWRHSKTGSLLLARSQGEKKRKKDTFRDW